MLANRLAQLPALTSGMVRSNANLKVNIAKCKNYLNRNFTNQSGGRTLRGARVKEKGKLTLKERLMAPAGDTAFTLGQGLMTGSAVVGLGALCFYGVGLGKQAGAIDRAALWPQVVKDRIKTTYTYFGGSLFFTAAAAMATARSPAMLSLVSRGGWLSLIATLAAMWGSGMVCMSLPYTEGFGAKQIAWIVHSSIIGAVIAPLTLMGGPIMLRAACYTAGLVGGLSTLATCAPSDKFLNWGGPLAMGFGVVFMAGIGSMFLPPTTALGAGMHAVMLYGGLVLFSAFLLYDTQKVIHRAETHPVMSSVPFDPVNNSVGIYLDTINIFVRLAMILSGGGNRRK